MLNNLKNNEFENQNKLEDTNDKEIISSEQQTKNSSKYSARMPKDDMPNCLLFEVVFRFLAANWIKIWIDHETFKILNNIYEWKDSAQVRQTRLLEEIKGFPAEDHTKSSIKEEDYQIAIETIFKNFPQIRNFWSKLPANEGLVVVTDRNRAWGSDDMNVKCQTKNA